MGTVQQSSALQAGSRNHNEIPVSDVGKRIRILRVLRGLEVKGLVGKLQDLGENISKGGVYKVERGDSSPTIRQCECIAKALGLTVGDLFTPDQYFSYDPFVAELYSYRKRLSYESWVSVFTQMKDLLTVK